MDHKHDKALIGFKKAGSHITKIISMIETDQYCVDVMQQNLAVIGLLKSAHQQLMESHLNSCFKDAINSNSSAKKQAMVQEILQVTKLNNK